MWDDYLNCELVPFQNRYNNILSIRGVPILQEWYGHESPLPTIYDRSGFTTGTSVSNTGTQMIPPPPQPDLDEQEQKYLE